MEPRWLNFNTGGLGFGHARTKRIDLNQQKKNSFSSRGDHCDLEETGCCCCCNGVWTTGIVTVAPLPPPSPSLPPTPPFHRRRLRPHLRRSIKQETVWPLGNILLCNLDRLALILKSAKGLWWVLLRRTFVWTTYKGTKRPSLVQQSDLSFPVAFFSLHSHMCCGV